MIIVKAILKSKLLDGIEVMTVPIGTEYFIDLNSKITLDWFNKDVNYGKKICLGWDSFSS